MILPAPDNGPGILGTVPPEHQIIYRQPLFYIPEDRYRMTSAYIGLKCPHRETFAGFLLISRAGEVRSYFCSYIFASPRLTPPLYLAAPQTSPIRNPQSYISAS